MDAPSDDYDGSNVRLYINGVQTAAAAASGAIASSTTPVEIGRWPSQPNTPTA